MASPMRAKQAWEEPKAASKEAVAFEKAVADLAESISQPRDMHGAAPEEPNDHRSWLEQQFAAIQSNQTRHEPNFSEQPDHEEAGVSGEAAHLRRRLDVQSIRLRLDEAARAARHHATIGLTRAGDLYRSGVDWSATKARVLAANYPAIAARSAALLDQLGDTLSRAASWSRAKAETLAPSLYARIAPALDRAWLHAKHAKLNQRRVIPAALLIICAALVLGSALFWRAGAPSEETDPAGPIAWGFEAANEPLAHKIVFTLTGTPQAFRIQGLQIRAENTLDQPLTSVEGVIRPDTQRPDLKLMLDLDHSRQQVDEPKEVDIEITSAITTDTIPARAPFNLVYVLQGGSLSAEEFIDAYGGLTLNVRYEVDGKQRAVIQYLSPEMLQAQLDQIQAEGS